MVECDAMLRSRVVSAVEGVGVRGGYVVGVSEEENRKGSGLRRARQCPISDGEAQACVHVTELEMAQVLQGGGGARKLPTHSMPFDFIIECASLLPPHHNIIIIVIITPTRSPSQ